MARIARVVWPHCPYHVTHRGNRQGAVFVHDEDRRRYLHLLAEHATRASLRVWSYALMTNHVHLVVVPERPTSMAQGIGGAHRAHSRALHAREGWTGHLWAHRFYSTPLDEHHLWAAVRYVELNPVRASLVTRADEYPWSSARAHATGATDPVLDPVRPFPGPVVDWGAWLAEGMGDPGFAALRRNTTTGRPTGSEEFVRTVEQRSGRVLRPRKRGPRGTGASNGGEFR